jgi:hypothetical protein
MLGIFIMNLLCKVGGLGYQGVLGLGLMLVYFYYEFVLQGMRFRVLDKGVLGLGLIVVYLYFEFALPIERLRVVYGGVLELGLFQREY